MTTCGDFFALQSYTFLGYCANVISRGVLRVTENCPKQAGKNA
jgi:hypothetical protein